MICKNQFKFNIVDQHFYIYFCCFFILFYELEVKLSSSGLHYFWAELSSILNSLPYLLFYHWPSVLLNRIEWGSNCYSFPPNFDYREVAFLFAKFKFVTYRNKQLNILIFSDKLFIYLFFKKFWVRIQSILEKLKLSLHLNIYYELEQKLLNQLTLIGKFTWCYHEIAEICCLELGNPVRHIKEIISDHNF